MPLAERDLAVVAAARDAHGAALLLASVDVIGELVVGGDVVELGRGLVVPGAPGGAAVDGDDGALVAREQEHVGLLGVDPEAVGVVAPGSPAESDEGLPAIRGLPGRDVGDVEDVGILRIDLDLREVSTAVREASIVVDLLPALARVVGPVEAAGLLRVEQREHLPRPRGRHGEADAAHARLAARKPRRDLAPRGAAVVGLEEPARRELPRAAHFPGGLSRGPEHGEDHVGIVRGQGQVHASRVLVAVEDLLEGPAAVLRPEDAPLGVRAVGMAEGGDEDPVGVLGVHDDHGNLLGVAQAQVLPGLAAVRGAVDAVAGGEVGPLQAFAAAHVDHLRIRRRHGDGPDRTGRLVVEDRRPDPAVVVAAPHPAVVHADVEDVGRAGYSHRGHRAAATVGTDHPPAHLLEERIGQRLGGDGGGQKEEEEGQAHGRGLQGKAAPRL